MPIHIYKNEFETIAYLCDEEWNLATQIAKLENWIATSSSLPFDSYVADIGYSADKGASGGGGVFTLEMMRNLVTVGMEVYLSQYDFGDHRRPQTLTSGD